MEEAAEAAEHGKRERGEGAKRWHHFQLISPDRAILRGARSTEDQRFKARSRGRQASAAAAVALVCAQLLEPRKWTGGFVDRVLDYGDRLFRMSQTRARLASGEYMTSGLLHDEFFVGDYKCRICVESGLVFGNLRSEAVGAPCLSDGLEAFLTMESRNFGVLTSQGTSVAVWSQAAGEGGFFYFDPAPSDERGKRSRPGRACLMRFQELEGIPEVFLSSLDRKFDSCYCIDKVSLVRVKPVGRGRYQSQDAADLAIEEKLLRSIEPVDDPRDCEPDRAKPARRTAAEAPSGARRLVEKLPLSIELANHAVQAKLATEPLAEQEIADERYAYDDVKVNVPTAFAPLAGRGADATLILHGWTHEGSDAYKAKGAQSSANCVVAIGMKKARPVRSWLRKSLDEVLATGDAVFAQVRAAKPSVKAVTAADLDGARFEIDERRMILNVDLLTLVGTITSKDPAVLSLKRGLEEFFAQHADGVLECSSTAVAIWTQDDYFYLFDSKSCDASGLRVLGHKSGKKAKAEAAGQEKRATGKCCVIRFPRLSSLRGHFLRNLDAARWNDRFTIRRVEVVDDAPGVRDWNSFRPAVAGKSWILRGSLNSEDERFEEHSRGVQGLAMPVAALLSAKTVAPANWTREDVDDVVREGDAYYNWCIPPPAGDEVDDGQKVLALRNLKKSLYHKKRKVVIAIEESCVVGELRSSGDSDSPGLERGMRQFFENRRLGLVEAGEGEGYFAIWKFEEELGSKGREAAYYLFHDKPGERLAQLIDEPAAGVKAGSPACALRFLDPSEIASVLGELLRSEEGNGRADFSVHEVKVTSLSEPMTDQELERDKALPIRPELNNYSALGESGAFLAGSFAQGDEALFKKETRDRQQAASALVALATTKLFDPHLWHPQVLDDILKMADKLTGENAGNIAEAEDEDPAESARDYLLPSELVEREFFIGRNEIAVDVEEETAAGQLAELAKSLQDFFSGNRMGVFRYGQVMLPIWREGSVFFAMDPRGRQSSGTAAVHWYIDLQSLSELLLEASGHADGDFAIDSVTVENRYTESERPAQDFITDDRWYNFAKLSEGHWKIDCNVSLADETFAEGNRGRQSAAVCLMAIVFSKVYEPRHWSAQVLDEATITGDKLHSRSALRLGENKSFRPNEIISEFFLADRRISLRVHDCVEAGTLGGRNPKIQNISSGLSRFLDKSVAGCVTIARSTNVAIWMHDDFCYCFEPGASLARLENASLLADQLLSYGERESDFEITSVAVVDWNKLPPWKFDPSPAVRPSNLPPLNAYCKLPAGRARAILRGFTHQASDIFSESIRGRQTAANCIIALAMAVIKNPTSWTRRTLDEILTIGVSVQRESQKHTTKTSALRPKDIVRIFNIGVTVLAADVEEKTIAGIVADAPAVPDDKGKRGSSRKASKRKSSAKDKKKGKTKRVPAPPPPPIFLREGLHKFFENNNAGVLVTGRFMVAIWKDNGVYFMYDPRPRNDQGLNDDDEDQSSQGASCVAWFACMEPLYELISANINDDEKYANFEIGRVIVRTVSIEPLPCPAGYAAVAESARAQTSEADCPMLPIRPAAPLLLEQPRATIVDLESCFERVGEELGVLLASSHMSCRAYPSENRGLQSCAISAVAIVVSSLHAPSNWTPELLDACLKYGDLLHTECVRLARPGSRNLSPSELLRAFVVGDVRARICLRENLMAGLSLEHDLACALRLFFASNACGILHTANYALPVMEHWGLFYVLDPSARNGFKGDSSDGVACLIKCESAERLAKTVMRLFAFEEPAVYTLNAVQLLDLHFFTR